MEELEVCCYEIKRSDHEWFERKRCGEFLVPSKDDTFEVFEGFLK